MGKARWDFAGTKWKTSTVCSMVDGGKIPNQRLQITLRQVQMTRSTLAKQRGEVGEGQQRVWNAQHSASVPIDHIAVGGK